MVQTDECVDVISRMNEELDSVQERCQEAEALLCKIKALFLDTTPHDILRRPRGAADFYAWRVDTTCAYARYCDTVGL